MTCDIHRVFCDIPPLSPLDRGCIAYVPRLRWGHLPPNLRSLIETAMGARVIADHSQTGGYSPGMASRLELRDGRVVFAKAVSPAQNPQSLDLYRREIAAMRTLPPETASPTLLWSHDDGQWVVLVLEWVEGRHPQEPWSSNDLARVVRTLVDLATDLTPSPVEATSAVEDLASLYGGWRYLADQPERVEGLDAWAQQNLGLLAELESGWVTAVRGHTLLHTDLRADNILLTPERVVLLDWAYAVQGAAWLDLAMLLPSVAASTPGLDPQKVWESSTMTRGVSDHALNAVLSAQAGALLAQSLEPPPLGIDGLREHQNVKGQATLDWLRTRLAHSPTRETRT